MGDDRYEPPWLSGYFPWIGQRLFRWNKIRTASTMTVRDLRKVTQANCEPKHLHSQVRSPQRLHLFHLLLLIAIIHSLPLHIVQLTLYTAVETDTLVYTYTLLHNQLWLANHHFAYGERATPGLPAVITH